MDKKYIELFKQLAQSTAATAEQVMDYDKQLEDEKGFNTAETMRNDYQALADKIDDNYQLTKSDAAKLTVAAMIIVNQLQDKITTTKRALAGYQTDVIPKLQDIVDNASDDEVAAQMSNEKFITKD